MLDSAGDAESCLISANKWQCSHQFALKLVNFGPSSASIAQKSADIAKHRSAPSSTPILSKLGQHKHMRMPIEIAQSWHIPEQMWRISDHIRPSSPGRRKSPGQTWVGQRCARSASPESAPSRANCCGHWPGSVELAPQLAGSTPTLVRRNWLGSRPSAPELGETWRSNTQTSLPPGLARVYPRTRCMPMFGEQSARFRPISAKSENVSMFGQPRQNHGNGGKQSGETRPNLDRSAKFGSSSAILDQSGQMMANASPTLAKLGQHFMDFGRIGANVSPNMGLEPVAGMNLAYLRAQVRWGRGQICGGCVAHLAAIPESVCSGILPVFSMFRRFLGGAGSATSQAASVSAQTPRNYSRITRTRLPRAMRG